MTVENLWLGRVVLDGRREISFRTRVYFEINAQN